MARRPGGTFSVFVFLFVLACVVLLFNCISNMINPPPRVVTSEEARALVTEAGVVHYRASCEINALLHSLGIDTVSEERDLLKIEKARE